MDDMDSLADQLLDRAMEASANVTRPQYLGRSLVALDRLERLIPKLRAAIREYQEEHPGEGRAHLWVV